MCHGRPLDLVTLSACAQLVNERLSSRIGPGAIRTSLRYCSVAETGVCWLETAGAPNPPLPPPGARFFPVDRAGRLFFKEYAPETAYAQIPR